MPCETLSVRSIAGVAGVAQAFRRSRRSRRQPSGVSRFDSYCNDEYDTQSWASSLQASTVILKNQN